MNTYYLDNAATTKLSHIVFAEMLPYLRDDKFGNPSSLHSKGKEMRKAIEIARERVAKAINAEPKQVFFTSGATESNNWVCSNFNKALCSPYEHHSILNNPNVTPMDIGISLQDNISKYQPELLSYIWVNNETGDVYDAEEISTICHENNIPFHTDGTQAFGHIPVDVKQIDCDFLSLSGHKFHAPIGIGILYIKEPNKFKPMLYGGKQEYRLRAGTENVSGIVGIGKAMELYNYTTERYDKYEKIFLAFIEELMGITDCYYNTTDLDSCIPSTLNISFKSVESESLMLLLDMNGIYVSSGSACNSGSLEPSHVLKAIGTPEEYIYNSIRLSWDTDLTEEDVKYIVGCIKNNVMKVRGYI